MPESRSDDDIFPPRRRRGCAPAERLRAVASGIPSGRPAAAAWILPLRDRGPGGVASGRTGRGERDRAFTSARSRERGSRSMARRGSSRRWTKRARRYGSSGPTSRVKLDQAPQNWPWSPEAPAGGRRSGSQRRRALRRARDDPGASLPRGVSTVTPMVVLRVAKSIDRTAIQQRGIEPQQHPGGICRGTRVSLWQLVPQFT
jgi:hypothetical protein